MMFYAFSLLLISTAALAYESNNGYNNNKYETKPSYDNYDNYDKYDDHKDHNTCRKLKHLKIASITTVKPQFKNFERKGKEYVSITCGRESYSIVVKKDGATADIPAPVADHLVLASGFNVGVVAKCNHRGKYTAKGFNNKKATFKAVACVKNVQLLSAITGL